jgi:hypothetical protein
MGDEDLEPRVLQVNDDVALAVSVQIELPHPTADEKIMHLKTQFRASRDLSMSPLQCAGFRRQ